MKPRKSLACTIKTYTGVIFSPFDPRLSDIKIIDIAHSLANQCRYNGHTRWGYSVGEHSVRVSELLEARGYSRPIQLWGLLHDASEAYLLDLPQPLKQDPTIGPAYRHTEKRLMRLICLRFGLPKKEPRAVKVADQVLLATEVRDIMRNDESHWRERVFERPLKTRIRPWLPAVVKFEFLRRYKQLGGKVT